MRFGIRLPPCVPADRLAEAAATAERLGFAAAWFPDSQLLWRDAFATATAAALRTESIQLGIAVSNVVTRHPSVLASTARTVGELAPGRFVLGVGAGNSSLQPVGLSASPQAQLRQRLAVVRRLLDGDHADFGPVSARMTDPAPGLPIYLAASGPRNLRLAGEIANGVILLSGVSPEALRASRARIADGAAAAGRPVDSLDLVVSAHCHITSDVEADARMLKPICAGIAQHGGTEALRRAGIDISVPSRVDGVYPDLVHAEDWELAVRRCSEWVSDADAVRFANAFCLFGTPDEIVTRLDGLAAEGVTSVFIQHVGSYSLPHELMATFAESVLAA